MKKRLTAAVNRKCADIEIQSPATKIAVADDKSR